jgi:hypothetical protein
MLRRQAGARVVSSPDRPNCAAKASSSQPGAYFQYVGVSKMVQSLAIKLCRHGRPLRHFPVRCGVLFRCHCHVGLGVLRRRGEIARPDFIFAIGGSAPISVLHT